jgi:hypothetical protein
VPKKPRLLLLDAMSVVAAFEAEAWNHLITSYDVVIPGSVAGEAHFYEREGRRYPIDLSTFEAAGKIRVADMDASDLQAVRGRFTRSFGGQIHVGEVEALAYLLSLGDEVDIRLVTSDRAALHATALLDLAHRCTCLHDVMRASGMTKELEAQYKEPHLKECLAEGHKMRITGIGLARSA